MLLLKTTSQVKFLIQISLCKNRLPLNKLMFKLFLKLHKSRVRIKPYQHMRRKRNLILPMKDSHPLARLSLRFLNLTNIKFLIRRNLKHPNWKLNSRSLLSKLRIHMSLLLNLKNQSIRNIRQSKRQKLLSRSLK